MKAIVAMAPNRVIGFKGSIPWHYIDDLRWFKEFTMGKTLVMGYKTYQSLPMFLTGREICVISKICNPADIIRPMMKADEIYFRYPPDRKDPWVMDVFDPEEWPDAIVAGGAKTYALLLPYITEIYVTHVVKEYEGDTYMPEFESQFPYQQTIRESNGYFSIVKYSRNI